MTELQESGGTWAFEGTQSQLALKTKQNKTKKNLKAVLFLN